TCFAIPVTFPVRLLVVRVAVPAKCPATEHLHGAAERRRHQWNPASATEPFATVRVAPAATGRPAYHRPASTAASTAERPAIRAQPVRGAIARGDLQSRSRPSRFSVGPTESMY